MLTLDPPSTSNGTDKLWQSFLDKWEKDNLEVTLLGIRAIPFKPYQKHYSRQTKLEEGTNTELTFLAHEQPKGSGNTIRGRMMYFEINPYFFSWRRVAESKVELIGKERQYGIIRPDKTTPEDEEDKEYALIPQKSLLFPQQNKHEYPSNYLDRKELCDIILGAQKGSLKKHPRKYLEACNNIHGRISELFSGENLEDFESVRRREVLNQHKNYPLFDLEKLDFYYTHPEKTYHALRTFGRFLVADSIELKNIPVFARKTYQGGELFSAIALLASQIGTAMTITEGSARNAALGTMGIMQAGLVLDYIVRSTYTKRKSKETINPGIIGLARDFLSKDYNNQSNTE